MSTEYLRKYGTASHVYVPMIKRAVMDFAIGADWTPAAGDVKISKDGAAAANIASLPTAIVMGNAAMWDFSFSNTELQAAKIMIVVADSATKVVEDQFFSILTYGNASAEFRPDFATGTAGPLPTSGTGADQVSLSGGRANADVLYFGAVAGTFAAGRPEVNMSHMGGSTTPVTQLTGLAKQRVGGGTFQAGTGASSLVLQNGTGSANWTNNMEIQITSGAATGLTCIVAAIAGPGGATPTVTPKNPTTLATAPANGDPYEVFAIVQADDAMATAVPGTYPAGTVGYILGNYLNTDLNAAFGAVTTTLANITTDLTAALNRIGAWAGTGLNTLLGAFRALLRSDATAPSDIGGTFTPTTDSTQAIRDSMPTGAVVASELTDFFTVDTWPELASLPSAAAPTILQMMQFVYELGRNKSITTATQRQLFKSNDVNVLGNVPISDSGSALTRGRFV